MILRFTPQAVADLTRLKAFIAEKNEIAARRILANFIAKINSVIDHPNIGRPVEDLPRCRDLSTHGYIIRYRVDANPIWILGVWNQQENRA